MNKNGYIYTTREVNSDNTYIQHNGLPKVGVGRTNNPNRRFEEHHNRGSKSSVGVKFTSIIDCDELDMIDVFVEDFLHTVLVENFDKVSRISSVDSTNRVSTTEVYSGVAKKTIKGVFEKNEKLSEELIKRIVVNRTNIDLFKEVLNLFPHQYEAYIFMLQRWEKGETNVLLSHKPRSGKTFITYNYLINHKPKNVLLLTQYPSLNKQWKKDFQKLRGHDYNIIISKDVDKVILDENRENFVMISLQDAKGSDMSDNEMVDGLKKQKFNYLKKITWDLIIFDEVHKGKETKKTDNLLKGLKYHKLLGLTATPTKNILRGTFKKENIHSYDLKNEQHLNNTMPDLYKNPKISYHLFNVDNEIGSEMEYFTKEEGFTFNKFSRVEDGKLVYHNDHMKLFNYIFGIGRYKNRKIRRLVDKSNSILIFVDNNQCQPIIRDLLNNLVGDVYDVHFTNSDVTDSNTLISKIENDYKPKDGKKSIIIANRQLTTGLTLKYCDMVIFLNDWKSVDEYIQASYRCQSTSDGKKECYVLDFNPGRCFNIIHKYIESISTFKGSDVSIEIKEYLECLPIFEYMGGDIKEIDFESFKDRISDYSGIDDKFFPNSIMMPEDTIREEINNVMILNGVGGDNTSVNVKLDDNTDIELGKNVVKSSDKVETDDKGVDNLESNFNNLMNTVNYLKDRIQILCLTTEFKHDSLESIFKEIDSNDNLKKQLIENLMLENFIK